MEGGNEIAKFMRSLLDDFKCIKGKSKTSCGKPYWDVVIITTADSTQKEAFQLQIDEKIERNELPLDLIIHVLTDQPGIRLGNGGSTLLALEFLETLYGSEMYKMKTLMIHAGGWSQRMPSAAVLGKVFSVLPHGSPPYQMLDLKLALYWPFVDKIEPGVFLVCADDFLIYSFMADNDWKIPSKGFTALAHPSPIEIGRTHGVYVIKNIEELDTRKPVDIKVCLEVLQKPSDARMKAQGALLKGESHHFADGISIDGEAVYTDSCFYFGTDIMEKLLNLKKSVGDLSCEIDAYGDFLQAVGISATNKYIHIASNVSQMTASLLHMRQSVFDCLNGSDIHVLVLNASAFIHIGTIKELLYHFCQDKHFQHKLGFENDVFNAWMGDLTGGEVNDVHALETKIVKRNNNKVSVNACVIHSVINSQSIISDNCVIEYCEFEPQIQISSQCILSNCQLTSKNLTMIASQLIIPGGIFLHTVPIIVNDQTKFVTVFFSVEDNLKKSVLIKDLDSLPFLGSDVGHFMRVQGLSKEDILPQNYKNNVSSSNLRMSDGSQNDLLSGSEDRCLDNISLWDLRLYPAKETMTSSLEDSILAITRQERKKSARLALTLFSHADLLKLKDVKSMLKFRKKLFNTIGAAHS